MDRSIGWYLDSLGAGSLPDRVSGAWAFWGGTTSAPRSYWIGPDHSTAPTHLGATDLLVWAGTVKPEVSLADLAALAGLDATELARLGALKREAGRAAYAAVHAALRFFLSRLLGCPPGALRFRVGRHGKPALCPESIGPAGDVHFNVSHTGRLGALALARVPVGIDIEEHRWSEDLMDVARMTFGPEQVADLEACVADERVGLFFRQWTLGEALIKATGMGLHQGIDGFAFTPHGPPRLCKLEPRWGPPDHWHFGLF